MAVKRRKPLSRRQLQSMLRKANAQIERLDAGIVVERERAAEALREVVELKNRIGFELEARPTDAEATELLEGFFTDYEIRNFARRWRVLAHELAACLCQNNTDRERVMGERDRLQSAVMDFCDRALVPGGAGEQSGGFFALLVANWNRELRDLVAASDHHGPLNPDGCGHPELTNLDRARRPDA